MGITRQISVSCTCSEVSDPSARTTACAFIDHTPGFGPEFFDEYHKIHPRSEPHYEQRIKLYELYHHLNVRLLPSIAMIGVRIWEVSDTVLIDTACFDVWRRISDRRYRHHAATDSMGGNSGLTSSRCSVSRPVALYSQHTAPCTYRAHGHPFLTISLHRQHRHDTSWLRPKTSLVLSRTFIPP